MRLVARAGLASVLAAGLAAGCAPNTYVQSQIKTYNEQQLALSQKSNELQSRIKTLDDDNKGLEIELAQSRQQSQLLNSQVTTLQEQLNSVTTQLAQSKGEKDATDEKIKAITASNRKLGATITANSSLRDSLPAINLPGVVVRADGDVVRIELPESQLFQPGGAQWKPGAAAVIDSVAAEVVRTYPEQIIGVEGHTDSDPVRGGQWGDNHQLSVGYAMAVYNHMITRTRLRPGQLFVVGHGANHPVVSNGSTAGKERNRRVELVVYPEKAGR
ncbi:MAG: OmpA/MotB family protein [Pirellulales bacterium]